MNRPRRLVSFGKTHSARRLRMVAVAALLALMASVTVLALAIPRVAQADPASPEAPTVYYVDKDATGAQTGENWGDALTSLQDALDKVTGGGGVEIWVAEGVYYPDKGLSQTPGDRTATFELKPSVAIYGGFDGTESSVLERDWVNNVTVLSGDLSQNDLTDPNGVVTDPNNIVGPDNAYHVVTAKDVMSAAKVDGFVITAGLADSTTHQAHLRGAGIFIDTAEPTLANLIIQGNKAKGEYLTTRMGYGGGMYALSGTPQCSNVTVRNNYAWTSGGGLFVEDSDDSIANLTFEGNVAGDSGGGLYVTNSDGGITSLIFEDNVAGFSGGGMYVTTSAGHNMSNLTFTGNSVAETGGGLYIYSAVPSSLVNSDLYSNSAQRGGGLYASDSELSLNNVSFGLNDASEHGGGLFVQRGEYTLTEATFTSNHAASLGGGLYGSQNLLTLNVPTFTSNTAQQGAGIYVDDLDLPDASLTAIAGVFVGNQASQDGGGLYIANSPNGTLDIVSLLLNEATTGNGGGIYLLNSAGYDVTNTDFLGNTAISGGGVHLTGSSHATFSKCTFSDNSAANGGGMSIDDSNPTLTNVSFAGNQVSGSGGGLWNDEGIPILTNVLFSGNASTLDGGGMRSGGSGSNPVLINATFSGNAAGGSGGGLHTSSPNTTIHNSIFWDNKDSSGIGSGDASIVGAVTLIEHSLVQGQTPAGTGNLDGMDPDNDPLFVVPVDPNTAPTGSGDLSVQFGSPIVDVGDNTPVAGVAFDIAGNPRIYNAIVDMGAYELPLACPPLGTTHLYVDHAANGGNTGVSGPDALEDLRDAFTLAANCGGIVEILVAQGVYRPDEGVGVVADGRSETYELMDDIAVYGGFDGPNFLPEERDWQTNTTVLSGDIDRNDINSGGIVLDPGNINGANSFHVVTGGGTGSTAILDGFVITAGQANGSAIDQADRGAGLYNDSSSPTLANLSFVGNFAGDGAGLANVNSSNPSLTGVDFQSNTATSYGGAILNTDSNPTVTGSYFRSNIAGSAGGAIYNGASDPLLTNVSFRGNTAGSYGGAIHNLDSSPTMTNTLISGNSASAGAAIYNTGSSPTLINITVSGNRATSTGGGMFNTNTSLPGVTNSIFWGNQDSTGTGTASATINNHDAGSIPVINYCLVQELAGIVHTGDDNFDAKPWFTAPVDPSSAPTTAGDYTLGTFSPAIDVGDEDANSTSTDLAGDPRIINGKIDLGAYEAPYRPVYRTYLPTVLRNYP